MKKLILSVVAIALSATTLWAQDIIVKQNGEEVKVKVEEIGDSQIKFRKWENLQGAVYSINSSEVFIVKFENGTKEVITPLDAPASATTASATTASATTPAEEGKYAHIAKKIRETKKPIHDKSIYVGPMVSFGYTYLNNSKGPAIGGCVYSAGVTSEYFFDTYSASGLAVNLSYNRYALSMEYGKNEADFPVSHLNWDVMYTYRPKGAFSAQSGLFVGIPIGAKLGDADAIESVKTVVGLKLNMAWSTKHTDLGAGLFYSVNNFIDSGDESSKVFGVTLNFAYRF